ncbi:MAG: hypothetical protein ACRCWO_03725 [Bosea sp. (in: a-proteobacteria)]
MPASLAMTDAAPFGLDDTDSVSESSEQPESGPHPDRNPIFSQLVKSDEDVIGLVAYALYKQSKRDWMIAFGNAHKRAPNEAELRAFIVGERTDRRIVTYRRLAEDVLGHFHSKGTTTKSLMVHSEAPVATVASTSGAGSQAIAKMSASSGKQDSFLGRAGTTAKIAIVGFGLLLITYLVGSRLLGR